MHIKPWDHKPEKNGCNKKQGIPHPLFLYHIQDSLLIHCTEHSNRKETGCIVPVHQVFKLDTDQGIKKIPNAGSNRHPTSVPFEKVHQEPEEQVK